MSQTSMGLDRTMARHCGQVFLRRGTGKGGTAIGGAGAGAAMATSFALA
jgi:hypothetical protein